uniref:Uncharacterized protein n=1 Tax=uncultured prokaryote TaxID=198431 RepID=A0A0H5QP10_9ZZZZ|nr:hypothetical protein [uncultured prokaryote]
MSAPKVSYEGLGLSEDSLVVFLTIGEPGARRVRSVRIPLADMTDKEFIYAFNQAVNRRMRAAWEEDVPFLEGL